MSLQTALRTVLFEKYGTFSGRAGRAEYWWFTLSSWGLTLAMLFGSIRASVNEAMSTLLFSLWLLTGLLLFIPSLAVTFRRLHDVGQNGLSGAYLLLVFVPFGGIALLIMTLLPTGPDNRYGPGDNRFVSLPGRVPAPVQAPVPGFPDQQNTAPSPMAFAVPAGWLPDPENPANLRYWDGSGWTASRFRPTDEPEGSNGA